MGSHKQPLLQNPLHGMQEMPEMSERYEPAGINNGDKTGLFYQILRNHTLFLKGERCHSSKKSKLRILVML